MKYINLNCSVCEKEFKRRKTEHTRNIKKGRKVYCSLQCSGRGNAKNLKEFYGKGNVKDLVPNNRKDEYSEFKWFIRVIKKRNKLLNNVDLSYLKDLWEEQNGICPLTGWKLTLPKHSSDWEGSENKHMRASIDRIDSNIGYVKGNIRYVAFMANICKNTFTDEEVIQFCEAVHQNRNKKLL